MPGHSFSGKTFKEGRLYRFRDLTPQGRKDAALHFQDLVGDEPREQDVGYRFLMLSQDDLIEMLSGSYGPTLTEEMDDPYVQKLEADIRRRGLQNPPVGGEGMHRLLALARIGKGAPYFDIEYPR